MTESSNYPRGGSSGAVTLKDPRLIDNLLFRHGAETQKGFSELSVTDPNGVEQCTGTYFLKIYRNHGQRSFEDAKSLAELDQKKYQMAKALGIPVPKECFYVNDQELGPCLAISDLTENGTKDVWSINNTDLHDTYNLELLKHMALTVSDFEQIASQIEALACKLEQNTETNMAVSGTGFFLTGNRDTGFQIVVGDFGDGLALDNTPKTAGYVTRMGGNMFLDLLKGAVAQVNSH